MTTGLFPKGRGEKEEEREGEVHYSRVGSETNQNRGKCCHAATESFSVNTDSVELLRFN